MIVEHVLTGSAIAIPGCYLGRLCLAGQVAFYPALKIPYVHDCAHLSDQSINLSGNVITKVSPLCKRTGGGDEGAASSGETPSGFIALSSVTAVYGYDVGPVNRSCLLCMMLLIFDF